MITPHKSNATRLVLKHDRRRNSIRSVMRIDFDSGFDGIDTMLPVMDGNKFGRTRITAGLAESSWYRNCREYSEGLDTLPCV